MDRDLSSRRRLPTAEQALRVGVFGYMTSDPSIVQPLPAGVGVPVLVVASDPDVAAALAGEIALLGVTPRVVESPHAAVEVLLQNATAVVVADGRVRRDGVDLIEMARQVSPATRLLMIEPPETVHTLPRDVLVLEQPAHPLLLRNTVSAALGLGMLGTHVGPAPTEEHEPETSNRLLWLLVLAIVGAGAGALAFFALRQRTPAHAARDLTLTRPLRRAAATRGSGERLPVTAPLDQRPARTKRTASPAKKPAAPARAAKAPARAAKARVRPRHQRPRAVATGRPRARKRRATHKPARRLAAKPRAAKPPAPKPTAPEPAAPAPAATPVAAKPATPPPPTPRKPHIGTVGSKRKPNIGLLD